MKQFTLKYFFLLIMLLLVSVSSNIVAQSGEDSKYTIGITGSYSSNNSHYYPPYRIYLQAEGNTIQTGRFKICNGINFSAFSIMDVNKSFSFLLEYSLFPFSPEPENYEYTTSDNKKIKYEFNSSGLFNSFSLSALFNILGGNESNPTTSVYLGLGISRGYADYKIESNASQTGYSTTYESFKFYFKPAFGTNFSFTVKQKMTDKLSLVLRVKSTSFTFTTKKIKCVIKREKDDIITYDLEDYYNIFPSSAASGNDSLKEMSANYISYSLGIGMHF